MSFTLHMIDVFGSALASGNPLAVITGADNLTTAEMQQLTRWFNLSETTFLLPPTHPQADYRVRIFSLDRELPFAGHPTLGSCHAWLSGHGASDDKTSFVQECDAGLIAIRNMQGQLSFAAPPLIRSGTPTPAELEEVRQVLALNPVRNWSGRLDVGVIGPHMEGKEAAFEVRAFFSDHLGAIIEDPVTGSLNASLAQWLFATGVAEKYYIAAQGTRLGRQGRIYINRDDSGEIWVGGKTHIIAEGQLYGF